MPNRKKQSNLPVRKKPERGPITSSSTSTTNESQLPPAQATRKKHYSCLPLEIITLIVSLIPFGSASQPQLHALTLVSRLWYSAAIARLYQSPHLHHGCFEKFVRTINSGVNRNGPADSTVRLDLSKLVETVRLIGFFKEGLEDFLGFKWEWGYVMKTTYPFQRVFLRENHPLPRENGPAALSKCSNLRHLDLSSCQPFGGFLNAADVSRATDGLHHLETFHFPGVGLEPPDPLTEFTICPNHVRELYIDSGLQFYFSAWDYLRWPKSLTHLSIDRCGGIFKRDFKLILRELGPQLQYLHVGWDMYTLTRSESPFDGVLEYLPRIRHLSLSRQYICALAPTDLPSLRFWPEPSPWLGFSPLVELEADNYFSSAPELAWYRIWSDVVGKVLPNLRKVRVYNSRDENEQGSQIVTNLNELLRALAREDGGATGIDESRAGIWFIEGSRDPNC